MNIVVYCSSTDGLDSKYEDTAVSVGNIIGTRRCSLLYGGVKAGMMHITADNAAKNGAEDIVGVIPAVFSHCGDELLTEKILTRDLNERKAVMIDKGDIFVVLPGGLGTIDEWISTLSHFKVNKINKPIIIANINGVFDAQIAQLENTAESVFTASADYMKGQIVCNTAEELENALNNCIDNLISEK